eukprot:438339-Amphidinium_carterae.3
MRAQMRCKKTLLRQTNEKYDRLTRLAVMCAGLIHRDFGVVLNVLLDKLDTLYLCTVQADLVANLCLPVMANFTDTCCHPSHLHAPTILRTIQSKFLHTQQSHNKLAYDTRC